MESFLEISFRVCKGLQRELELWSSEKWMQVKDTVVSI